MGVGYFEPQYHLGHLLAGESLADGLGHALCKHLITGQLIIIEIEDVIDLTTGNHQRVTLYQRIDVEESIELLVLGTLVTGNLTSSNL